MIDRVVEMVYPKLDDAESRRTFCFSDFLGEKNIVLLGDPGAGKTYLFNCFSRGQARVQVVSGLDLSVLYSLVLAGKV
ncbi:MAG: hypothetical protein LAT66_04630 [Alkalimonas sp.]|nr:hypothetical protein [Alkalimonas sp.]